MQISDYIITLFSSIFVSFFNCKCYEKLSNYKMKYNIETISTIIFLGVIYALNGCLNDSTYFRAIFNIIAAILSYKIIFDDNTNVTIIKTIVSYIFVAFFEVIFSCILVYTNIINLNQFDIHILFKSAFSMGILFVTYSFISLKKVNVELRKIISKCANDKIMVVILSFCIIFLIIISAKYITDFSEKNYINNMLLLVIFAIILFISLYNNYKAKKEVEKTETLLDFMSKYEKIIDDDRINRHEMLNNLLILKSSVGKSKKEYMEILESIIATYDKKGKETVKNIYKLPSGLKGIIYYKIRDMKQNNLNINVNISREVTIPLEKLTHKEYVCLCKIIAITLDNANEASKESEEKVVFIDIYQEKNNTYLIIENTFANKVDLNKVNKMNYSSKGKGRGLGLYVANMFLKESKKIEMNQSIDNNRFVSKIIVKK